MSIQHQPSELQQALEYFVRELHPQWSELGEGERGQFIAHYFLDYLKDDQAQPTGQEIGI